MSPPATEYVIHSRIYTDYDKPWGNRWQFLVSDRNANILSNLLAILLALAGNGVYNIWRRVMRSRGKAPPTLTTARISGSSVIVTVDAESVTINGADAIHGLVAAASAGLSNTGDGRGPIGLGALSRATGPEQATVDGDANSGTSFSNDTAGDEANDVTSQAPPRTYRPDGNDTVVIDRFGGPVDLVRYHFRECVNLVIPRNDESKAVFLRIFDPQFWRSVGILARETPGELLWHVLILTIALSFYFGTLIVAIVGPYPVVGDSTALSRHPRCGVFTSIKDPEFSTPEEKALQWEYHNQAFRESRQFAKLCYGSNHDTAGAHSHDSCSFFYKRKIDYTVWDDQPCPFWVGSEPLCLEGEDSAYSLATGSKSSILVDANVIGINSARPYQFHRSITCSPLKTDGYVQKVDFFKNVTYGREDVRGLRYSYGHNDNSCMTELPDCSFDWPYYPEENSPYIMLKGCHDLAQRTMTTSTTTLEAAKNPWSPIFRIDDTFGHTASHLILISNAGITYPNASLDPIFFANYSLEGDQLFPGARMNGTWFTPGSFKAGVLACLSRDLICRTDTIPSQCMLPFEGSPDSLPDGKESPPWSMIVFSTLFGLGTQLDFLRAESLDAQSLLRGTISAPLSKHQWKHEVRQMFETVLAHTQIEARNIARGRPGGLAPGLENNWRNQSKELCTQYKFHAVGWRNISVSWFIGELLGALFLCFAGWTNEKGEFKVKNLWKSIGAGVSKVCFEYIPETKEWICLQAIGIFGFIRDTLAGPRRRGRRRP